MRNLAHGEFGLAFNYHPFGYLVLPYVVVAASHVLWPERLRARVHEGMSRRRSLIYRAGGVVLGLFLTFGIVRFVLAFCGVWVPLA